MCVCYVEREREWEYKNNESKHFIDYSHSSQQLTAKTSVELLPYLFRDSKRERERWTEHET